jgi:hypothetical protein
MDEIELAQKMQLAKNRKEKESTVQEGPSDLVPSGLRGMTAVASEAGTINASMAGKDVERKLEKMDEFDVVESNVVLAAKGGQGQMKFKYGRNSTSEIEAGAKRVEKAGRRRGESRKPGKAVRVSYPQHSKRSYTKEKRPDTSSDAPYYDSNTDKENQPEKSSENPVSEEVKPTVRPKSALRASSYGTQVAAERASTTISDEVSNLAIPDNEKPSKTTLEQIPQDKPLSSSVIIPRTPAMPTYYDLQTKSNPELAAQLIARALRVDFV